MKNVAWTIWKHFITSSAVFAIAALMVPPVEATPLHHWKLDESVVPFAADTGTSATHFDATLKGGASWLPGGGVQLNGSDDYINLADNFTFAATNGFSFAAWVRFDSFQAWSSILSLEDETFSNSIVLMNYSITRRGSFYVQNHEAASYFITPADFFGPVGTWAHVAATVTPGGTVTLYRDGETSTEWTINGEVATNPNYVMYSYASFGGRDSLGSNYFHGGLRDVRIYDRAMSAAEVDNLYNSTVPEPSSLALFVIGGMAMTGYGWQRNAILRRDVQM